MWLPILLFLLYFKIYSPDFGSIFKFIYITLPYLKFRQYFVLELNSYSRTTYKVNFWNSYSVLSWAKILSRPNICNKLISKLKWLWETTLKFHCFSCLHVVLEIIKSRDDYNNLFLILKLFFLFLYVIYFTFSSAGIKWPNCACLKSSHADPLSYLTTLEAP